MIYSVYLSQLTCDLSLILATEESEDPVKILREAAREHIPINPSTPTSTTPKNEKLTDDIPDTSSRPSVDDLIQVLVDQEWYREQIVFRKTVDAREPQTGMRTVPRKHSPKLTVNRRDWILAFS